MVGLLSAGRYQRVEWKQCHDPVLGADWCELLQINLSSLNFHGVYIIWVDVGGVAPLYVGKGNIRDRLGKHRGETKILSYGHQGTLCATWAEVGFLVSARMERYLADVLSPLVGEEWPDVSPIEVNLSWERIV